MATIEERIALANLRKLEEFDTTLKSFIERQLENVEENGKLFRIPETIFASGKVIALFAIMIMRFRRIYTDENGQLYMVYNREHPNYRKYRSHPYPITAQWLFENDMLEVIKSAMEPRVSYISCI